MENRVATLAGASFPTGFSIQWKTEWGRHERAAHTQNLGWRALRANWVSLSVAQVALLGFPSNGKPSSDLGGRQLPYWVFHPMENRVGENVCAAQVALLGFPSNGKLSSDLGGRQLPYWVFHPMESRVGAS